ncbi:ammonium transporter [Marinomonas mediterranea]|uniref:Ammonium transporter n=1 Tax=Marinomonas mediterranea (strain ATCC 700492 / JCM 21426 / NBRC 103028 / MMB-1) TaxID=717774 RepID=F2JWI0_MARM1|nr:ammonium transporter [Marinomonas mediterranea]ADZ90653.1 methyl-accepting chemotaxis sensory transducer [Marinomonas mediterranea MMB-1]WCN16823.1 ammonium transporter [Marinomonas mediterranea MMB-1]
MEEIQSTLDIMWIMIAASLVMFMQAGFTAFEAGLTRAKNSINVAMKNMTDFVVAIFAFWLLGYGLMFGQDLYGLWGTDAFTLSGLSEPADIASFVFQATFAGTAATIVSGAVAERIKFMSYVLVSLVLTAIIYPVSGHWIWNGEGWLAEKGMIDFAGSTVVHSVGAWVGLAGVIMLGARISRFDDQGNPKKIHGHSLVLAVIGTFILFFGWFGFNGGSTLEATTDIAGIMANTMLAAASSAIVCFVMTLFSQDKVINIEKILSGVIGGLVGITAGCAVVTPMGAVVIGIVTGIIVFYSEEVLLRVFRLDDPVNAVAVHGVAGVVGTLLLALVAPIENLNFDSRFEQFMVQLTGVSSVFIWSFFTGLAMFWGLKSINKLRVDPEHEKEGLNIIEHGASSGVIEALQAMQEFVTAHSDPAAVADLTKRLSVENGTENGDIATMFNRLLDQVEKTYATFNQGVEDLKSQTHNMNKNTSDISTAVQKQLMDIASVTQATAALHKSLHDFADLTSDITDRSVHVKDRSSDSLKMVEDMKAMMLNMQHKADNAFDIMQALKTDSDQIVSILSGVQDISEQTNLLALNAAIEAARAGESGRGFAVVADEVRQLSSKTNEATREISAVIESLQARTSSANDLMSDNQKMVRESNELMTRTIDSLSESNDEIVKVQSANSSINEMAQTEKDNISVQLQAVETIEASCTDNLTKVSEIDESSTQLLDVTNSFEQVTSSFKTSTRLQ